MARNTTVKSAGLAFLVALAAALFAAPAATGQVVSPIYAGTSANACPVAGVVRGTCPCSAVALPDRPSVLSPTEVSRLWCDVRGRSFTQYFCDEQGVAACRVLCTGPTYYCEAGSLRFQGQQCACAMTGNRVVVVPQ